MSENELSYATWLKSSEVAERLGVSPRTVTNWAARKKIGCRRTPGGHLRYPPEEVDRILSAGWQPAEEDTGLLELFPVALSGHLLPLVTTRRRAV